MSTQTLIIIMAIAFIASLLFDTYLKKKREDYTSYIVKLVTEGNFEQFDQEINSSKASRLIPPMNMDMLKFNVYIMRGMQKEVEDLFDSFENKRLSNDAKLTIYTRALGYFITTHDQNRCKKCYDIIMDLPNNDSVKKSTEVVYEIMVEKKTNRLNELLEELEKDSSTQKYIDEFLISEIYTNLNDEENAKKYADLAKEHVLHPED